MSAYSDKEIYDWSLHLQQLPLSCQSSLSAVYEVVQNYHANTTFPIRQDGLILADEYMPIIEYHNSLDGGSVDESNHAHLIMPAIIKHCSDSANWKLPFKDGKLSDIVNSCKKENSCQRSRRPSVEELNELARSIKKLAKSSQLVNDKRSAFGQKILPANPEVLTNVSNKLSTTSTPKSFSSSFHQINSSSHALDSSETLPCDNGRITCNESKSGTVIYNKFESNYLTNRTVSKETNKTNNSSFTFQARCDQPSTAAIDNIHSNRFVTTNKPVNYSGHSRARMTDCLPPLVPVAGHGAAAGGKCYPWQRKGHAHLTPSDGASALNGNHKTVPVENMQSSGGFRTASHQLAMNKTMQSASTGVRSAQYSGNCRLLGVRAGSSVNAKFVPPVRREADTAVDTSACSASEIAGSYDELLADCRMKNIETRMVELIMNEVLDSGLGVSWDDIAGLELAKGTIQEVVVWPMLRPDIFTGLRGPPKGVLLFGPPGTGKTMIGKAIASESGATFFSISASSLTSKWVGEGEKMVRALFAVARVKSPSVIFIDEIDSLLTQRSETEHESSRRMKTEFLVQLDGVGVLHERVLVVGATNRPQELDEAARRRLQKRLYVPLPDEPARRELVTKLLEGQQHTLTQADMDWVSAHTDGYSGADVASVCSEAAMGPVRSITRQRMSSIQLHEMRPITIEDFKQSVQSVRPSVNAKDLQQYTEWNKLYGICSTTCIL